MTIPAHVAIIVSVCPAGIREAAHAEFIDISSLDGTL
jgi:hypothetical protein